MSAKLDYKTNSATRLFKDVGEVKSGTQVKLESYFSGDKYARVSDAGGTEYLVEWNKLRKI